MTTIAHSPSPSLPYPSSTPHIFGLTQPPAVDSEGVRADGPGETRLPEPHEGSTNTAGSDVTVRRGEAAGDLMASGEDPIGEGAGAKAEEETVPTRVASELDIAIWREFKEDNYEIVDQLPLELQRNMNLLQEFDQHAASQSHKLQALVREYVTSFQPKKPSPSFPSATAAPDSFAPDATSALPVSFPSTTLDTTSVTTTNAEAGPSRLPTSLSTHPASSLLPPLASSTSTSSLPSTNSKPPLLFQIHTTLSTFLSKSHEKVSLAKNTYDQIDRQIRVLDFALKEFLAPPPNPHPDDGSGRAALDDEGGDSSHAGGNVAAIAAKRARENEHHQPADGMLVGDGEALGEGGEAGPVSSKGKNRDRSRKGKGGGRKGRKSHAKKGGDEPAEILGSDGEYGVAGAGEGDDDVGVGGAGVIAGLEGMEVDPNEPTYCYCGQVSYGSMIACDNDDCALEWFHLGCIGLTTEPEGTWFCRDCEPPPVPDPPKKKARR